MFTHKDLLNIESSVLNFAKELRKYEHQSKDLVAWADELDELVARVQAEQQRLEAAKAD